MPKTNSYFQEYNDKTDEYVTAIKVGMVKKKMNQKQLAKRVLMTPQTLGRNLKNLDNMRFGDLRAIAMATDLVIEIRGKGE